jgi:hypothetical protein
MEVGTLALGVIVAMATLLSVYLPLRLLARRGLREPRARRLAGFFVAIGLGYMAIEIGLLQRFALLLGHPNYALCVVLAALLWATGVGSLTSAWLVRRLKGELRFVSYGVALLVLGFLLPVSPRVTSLAGLSFAARVAIVFAIVTPLGLLLGAFFPSAVDALKTSAPAFVPWAWGLNGIASVLEPVVAVAISMTWGHRCASPGRRADVSDRGLPAAGRIRRSDRVGGSAREACAAAGRAMTSRLT